MICFRTAVRCPDCVVDKERHRNANYTLRMTPEGIQRPPGYCDKGIPVPRILCHNMTEVTDVPGKVLGILRNFQKFREPVRKAYITFRSSGYGYKCRVELPEIP